MRRSPSPLPPSSNFLTTSLSTPFSSKFVLASLIACVLAIASPLLAQTTPALVTQPVDNSVRTILPGNVHPLARAEFDKGEAPPDLALNRMLLVLKRSPQQETALRRLIENQQNKKSSSYHQWLTPEQFGVQYGPADSDLAAVTTWLQQSGFQVTQVSQGRTIIEFNGTAGQVKQAFGTAIHRYVVKGESHWANATNPSIPTALVPVIAGVNKLNSFRKKAHNIPVGTYNEETKQLTSALPNYTFIGCGENGTDPCYAVTPFDFATIYDVLPLWNAGFNGTGVTIALVGDSDINPDDATAFWTLFGLGTTVNGVQIPMPTLNVITNGPDPGFNGDETEGDVDTQWAGSVAPGATIDFVTSANTETDDGIDLSALYIIDNNLAPVMSESFGICEAALGSSEAYYGYLWEQAAAQGITVMVSTGDSGSAGCDDPNEPPTFDVENFNFDGLSVNGIASTPFNVAVGGTDFKQYNAQQTYWNSTNTPVTQESAKGTIPETTWNDSCTNSLFVTLGYGTTAEQACNNSSLQALGGLFPVGGSGGASVDWLTPTWQTGTGITSPANSRYLPDVSLFAGNGLLFSFYLICQSDAPGVGGTCNLTNLQGAGGTSFASPAFAGIMALVNQKTGSLQGNADFVLYNLSSKQPNAFRDVLAGSTIQMPCVTGSDPNCVTTNGSDAYGVLNGYATATGYDLATGLGSVDAANLVNNWGKVTFTPTTTTLILNSGNPVSITHGSSVPLVISVSPNPGTGTMADPEQVSLLVAPGTPGNPGVDGFTLTSGTTGNTSTNLLPGSSSFPGGTYTVIAHYGGDTTYGGSYSSPSASITVNPEGSSVYMPGVVNGVDSNDNPTYTNSVVYGTGAFDLYLLRADVLNSQTQFCTTQVFGEIACPTGTITFIDSLDGNLGTYNLNSLGYTEDQAIQLTGTGTGSPHTLTANYNGDPSYNASSASTTITVTPSPPGLNISLPGTAAVSQNFTITATVAAIYSYGVAPNGTVSFQAVSQQANSPTLPGTVTYTPVNGSFSAGTTASLAASLTTSISTAGTYTITAAFLTADNNYSNQSISNLPQIVVSAPGSFTIGSIANVTISAPGGSGTAQVTLTPSGGLTGNVNIVCTLPPAMTEATCPTVTANITNANAVTAMVTINTTGPHQVAAIRPAATGMLGFGVLAGVFVFAIPGLRQRKAPLAMLLFAIVVLIASCGGGSSSGHTDPGTPAGTYTVNLTATSGSVSVPASFSVTVQ